MIRNAGFVMTVLGAALFSASTVHAQTYSPETPPSQPPVASPPYAQPQAPQPQAPQPPPAQPVPPPAQPLPPPYAPGYVYSQPIGFHRSGFLIGFALGFGTMSQQDCKSCEDLDGGAGEFHIGGMLGPNAALMYDLSLVTHQPEGTQASLTHALHTIAGQYFFGRGWLKAGIGRGQLSYQENQSDPDNRKKSDWGTALMLAAGVELYQGQTFALDLQLRGATVTYENQESVENSDGTATITNVGVMLGFNWY